ncbi:MAG: hypothetical protein FWG65_01120 [Turicibacter sp.]|nr:hypothetical protein [Turicibacter sp.]
MAKLLTASGSEITHTSNPSVADYSSRYGDWIEVLANGGTLGNRAGLIIDKSGNTYVDFTSYAYDTSGEKIVFGKGGNGFEVINNTVDMQVIGYLAWCRSRVAGFFGLNGKLVFEIDVNDPNATSKKGGCLAFIIKAAVIIFIIWLAIFLFFGIIPALRLM